ncbi:MAG: S-layer homology domain-containing protein [Oscillospiraceae bacterium]|nr:S-layer homology domain-containing protein [Oscillospiraceae bacterium]
MKKRLLCLLIAAAALVSLALSAGAVSEKELADAVNKSASYMYETVKEPQPGAVGGEWAVLGLARSGCDIPESYYQEYYAGVVNYVRDVKGVIHEKKYSEYSRLIISLSAIGMDARDVAGYDLTKPLGDYDKTIWQGLNGPIWALIALDSRDYPMPQNPEAETQATRQMYVDRILSCQLSDGGWSLLGGTPDATESYKVSDPDITGMALQALAKYRDQPAVAKAIDEALDCMSKKQAADGGFSTLGTPNAESAVQILVALCELGISVDDERFVKNGITVLDNIMSYRSADGGFKHTLDGSGSNQLASEQCFYGLVAAQRLAEGKNSLYRMSDAISVSAGKTGETPGLPGKHPDVKRVPVTAPDTTFDDIYDHENRQAIEALASRGIINGMGDGNFAPDEKMNRAQFAAITVRALGLSPEVRGVFADVTADKWYAPYIDTASAYGIVNGVGDNKFSPDGTITRQEAATMVARAAKLCGMDTEYNTAAVRDILAQFGDYVKTAEWARAPLAFCYDSGILDDSVLNIEPTVPIKRCEIAQMLFNLLGEANLL